MKRAVTTRALAMLTWVLVLIAVPTGLYMSHVYNQLGEVRENNLRTLSKAADTTSQILETARQNVRNLRNDSRFMCEFLNRQPYLEWGLRVSNCENAEKLLDDEAGRPTLRKAAKEELAVDRTKEAGDSESGESGESTESGRLAAAKEEMSKADIESEIRNRARRIVDQVFQTAYLHAGADGVQIQIKPQPEDPPPETDPTKITENSFVFDVRMDAVLAAIPFGDALDLLFVADGAGDVVHQHLPESRPNAGLRVSSLSGLSAVGKEDPLKLEDLQRSSSINQVRISSTEYQLLCQPLQVSLDDTNEGNRDGKQGDSASTDAVASQHWLLCGLVASERLLKQSLAVAPFLAFTFFAVIIFGFLTWPAIKLLWMTKTDRLYFLDLCFLMFGTLGALMLATILVLGVGSHLKLSHVEEESLHKLADDIEANLAGEVDDLATAAQSIDTALEEIVRESDWMKNLNAMVEAMAGGCPRGGRWLHDIDNILGDPAVVDPEKERPCELTEPVEEIYNAWRSSLLDVASTNPASPADDSLRSDLQMVFWTGCDGKQILKVTPRGQNTPRVSIGHRRYFRAAMEDQLWQPRGGSAGPARYVETVRSVTTGKFTTIVSARSSVDFHQLGNITSPAPKPEIEEGCGGAVAVQAALISTSNTVLPPGVGFAIVDESGTAVLHSDERRALFENLFEEMEDGDRLESVVRSRSAQHLSTNYLGRPHRVFVKPLDNLPWSVVTFADTELLSTVNLEVLGHAALLASIYIVLYILVAIVYFATRGPEIPLWFWPGSHCGTMSHWPVSIPVMAFALLVLLMAVAPDQVLLPYVFALPALIFVALLAAYHWIPGGKKLIYSQDVRRSQVASSTAASFIVWVTIAILPAGIFFTRALDEQMAVLVHYENEYVAARTVDRNCAIDNYYRDVNLSKVCGGDANCQFDERRADNARDRYRSQAFAAAPVESAANTDLNEDRQREVLPACDGTDDYERQGTIWSAFGAAKPIYNRTVLGSRYLPPEERSILAGNACWSWQPGGNDEDDVSIFSAGPLPCNTWINLTSRRPLYSGYFLNRVVPGLGVLLLLMLFFWTRYGARNIFFGDLRMPKEQLRGRKQLEERLAILPNKDRVRLVIVAASQFDRSEMLRTSDEENKTRGHFNRYDMLDYTAGKEKRDELKKNLARDLMARTNILLISPVDPYSLLDADDSPEPVGTDPTGEFRVDKDKQRDVNSWRRILSRFRVVIVTVNLDPPQRAAKGIWQRELDRVVTEEWLDLELKALPELRVLRKLLVKEVVGSTRRNALDRIVERAFGNYMALWDACSPEEKLILVQIAFENVVNPKEVAIVRRLMQRGLLVRDPSLRIMNQSFARFIVQVQEPEEVRAWEQPTTGVSWTTSRWALLGVLLLALLFLWATQRELFNSTITFLTAAAVGLPGAIKVLSSLNRLNVQGDK